MICECKRKSMLRRVRQRAISTAASLRIGAEIDAPTKEWLSNLLGFIGEVQDVLAFYADLGSYEDHPYSGSDIEEDQGDRARATIRDLSHFGQDDSEKCCCVDPVTDEGGDD